ncbi:hypothetical protein [Thalassospira sp.]|uniref:hypothetical protein n=1 Tax=Thalassospira sp. TaxID=1912094 RepID=UPI001B13A91B|nr:hypothetical protein [Thalassospira sp.]MBO6808470.1 hypothetical protein [Thalassospira sp.]MBO6839832.1 hypothetical protein [Thalassospira sp.]
MEEKIARAICKADGINPEWAGSVDPDCTYDAWENYIPHARAALSSLKNPTDDMIDSVYGKNDVLRERDIVERDFKIMIQAAEEGK